MIYRGPGFLAFGSSPNPFPSPSSRLSIFLSLLVCRRLSFLKGDHGRGSKSYHREKDWSSMYHSIFFVRLGICHFKNWLSPSFSCILTLTVAGRHLAKISKQGDGWWERGQCILISVVFTPSAPATTVVFGSYLSSLYSQLTLYRRCGLAYPYD
jgi:hypothetical protein